MPRGPMLRVEHAVAAGGGAVDDRARLLQRVAGLPGGREADELRKRDGHAGRRIEGDLRAPLLQVAELCRPRQLLCYRHVGRPTSARARNDTESATVTTTCPGYHTVAWVQLGSHFSRCPSASRLGGGHSRNAK